MELVLVSSCLLGRPVRYDGTAKTRSSPILDRWRADGRLVPFCPELAGGLGVPRPPAELVGGPVDGGGRVLTAAGDDVTAAFVRGAELALSAALSSGARVAVLKEGSPSCGSHRVYDGTFSGRSVPGAGVTTQLLRSHGIAVYSEDELAAADAHLLSL